MKTEVIEIANSIIVPRREDGLPDLSQALTLKHQYINQGMYAFVSWKWVDPLVNWIAGRKVLEVMAGRGWLSYALRQKKVDVIATDNYEILNYSAVQRSWTTFATDVEKLDGVSAVEKYGNDVEIVIMSWPYMDNNAYEILKKMHEVNPNLLLVFIGTGERGFTANQRFYDHFYKIEDDEVFNLVDENYQRWPGDYDYPQLGRFSVECIYDLAE